MQTTDHVTQFNYSLPYYTAIPEDVVTNTWHMMFDVGGATAPTVTDYGNALDNLNAFYTSVYTGTARAPWVQSTATIKAYSLWLPPPHVPVFSGTRTVGGTVGASGSTAPTETAICMSYRADYIGGIPQARQRGRIFLGGFANPFSTGTSSSFPEVNSTTRSQIVTAASALKAAMLADNWLWVVLSPTQHLTAGQETFNVMHGYVDNAPDTQRRRGFAPTVRASW